MATYAIGDLQGCYDELQTLLKLIRYSSDSDQLWFVGDLVNRGPKSLECLEFIRKLSFSQNTQGKPLAITVLGNHDLHLVACALGVRKTHGLDTIEPILNHPECEQLISWLREQPLLHHDPALNFCMTHAGIPPNWTLDETKHRANEASNLIKRQPDSEFHQLFSNTPNVWDSALSNPLQRSISIINFLTRMRFIKESGELDLKEKAHPDQAPSSSRPWFSQHNSGLLGTRLVFGHWAALNGKTDNPQTFAIDTGCVWGNALTALRLEDLQRFSVPSKCNI